MKISPIFRCWMSILAFVVVCTARADDDKASTSKNGYTVIVQVKVSETGEAEEASIVSSDEKTPDDVLKKMAVAMALNTKFPPRPKNGVPAKYIVKAPFFFPIDDDEGAAANGHPMPKVKDFVQPVYPANLREKGEVGGVILELVIDAEGKLARLTTLRASHPEFEAAAVEAVKKSVFSPARKDGVAVESRSRIAIVFDTMEKMADLKWRIPPRPSLFTFTIIRPNEPLPDPAATEPAAPAAQPAPGK